MIIVGLLTPGSGYEGRIRHNSNGNMTLKSLKEEDSGTYKCTVTYFLGGIVEDSIDVIIYSKLFIELCANKCLLFMTVNSTILNTFL